MDKPTQTKSFNILADIYKPRTITTIPSYNIKKITVVPVYFD
jgi:hypothetical protein